MKKIVLVLMVILLITTGCDINLTMSAEEKDWSIFEKSAKGTSVSLVVDHTNPLAETWFKETLSDYLKTQYEISLNVVIQPMEKTLLELAEDKANEREQGQYDVILFENKGFKSARENGLLYGPFGDKLINVKQLLNHQMLDYLYREGIATDNYFVPYGRKQLSFIYNQDVFYERPETLDAFLQNVKEEKGLFTYPDPTQSKEGEAFLLTFIGQNMDLEPFSGENVNREAFVKAIQPSLDTLIALKPYLYKQIGRASCWERLLFWVGGGWIK